MHLTIRRGWNNFFKNFAKALDKCNSIEYNEIELAMQVGGISELLVVFLAVWWEIIKVQQIKFMGDHLRQGEIKMATKKAKKSNNTLFSIYGARESNSGERVNISLVCGDEDSKQWATVSIKKKGGKIKVKLDDEFVTLKIPRLDVEEDEEDEEDKDEEIPF